MLSGKYGLQDDEMDFLSPIYPPENYVSPNHTRFDSCRIWCCKKKPVPEREIPQENEENKLENTEDNYGKWSKETTDEAFGSLLDRHLDLKNFFQMCQDMEIIRKLLYSERHIILAP